MSPLEDDSVGNQHANFAGVQADEATQSFVADPIEPAASLGDFQHLRSLTPTAGQQHTNPVVARTTTLVGFPPTVVLHF